jgi:hypothetical protein
MAFLGHQHYAGPVTELGHEAGSPRERADATDQYESVQSARVVSSEYDSKTNSTFIHTVADNVATSVTYIGKSVTLSFSTPEQAKQFAASYLAD